MKLRQEEMLLVILICIVEYTTASLLQALSASRDQHHQRRIYPQFLPSKTKYANELSHVAFKCRFVIPKVFRISRFKESFLSNLSVRI